MGAGVDTGLTYGKLRQTYSAHLYGLSFGGIYDELMREDPKTEVKGGGRPYVYKYIEDNIRPDTVRSAVLRYGYWDEDLSMELDEMNTAISTYCDTFKANAIVKGFTDADWDNYCKELDSRLRLEDYLALYNAYLGRGE